MNTNIVMPYEIGQKLWILYKKRYPLHVHKIYTIDSPNLKAWYEEPEYAYKWKMFCYYLKRIEIDEDGIYFTFNENEDLTNNYNLEYEDGYDHEFWDKDIYIFNNEQDAINKLEFLNKE